MTMDLATESATEFLFSYGTLQLETVQMAMKRSTQRTPSPQRKFSVLPLRSQRPLRLTSYTQVENA